MGGTERSILDASGAAEGIRHFKEAIAAGENWYLALLEAIGLWDRPEEVHQGRSYRYLIGGEAFDWLLLAERLCAEVDGTIPEQEKMDLLFFGRPPVEVSRETARELIGSAKYRAYLNFLYGVLVEEALHLAVENEVRKEWGTSLLLRSERRLEDEVYERIYGATRDDLLGRFREERGRPQVDAITLEEIKEFTYWLFKLRLKESDKARVASDTRKGVEQLQRLRQLKGLESGSPL
ncbi:MAG: hypothetical protein HYX92_01555 [Chloroflexi bacterium]|nr:hypothetical protein [Chloroflexota bacterium]